MIKVTYVHALETHEQMADSHNKYAASTKLL